MDVSLVPVKKIGCPRTVFGPSSKQPPRIVVVQGAFFKDISYFGKNRISKNFGYRGASAQFFFALGEILANKKTLRKKSKICIFELKFFPVCAILKFFKNHYMRKLIFNSIFCFFPQGVTRSNYFCLPFLLNIAKLNDETISKNISR